MSFEIRPLTADEMPAFEDNLTIGFSSPLRRKPDPPPTPEIPPEWTLCAFEDGTLATTYAAFPFQMHLHGAVVPAAGVTAVSTLPWYRRRGYLRRIMEADFRRMKDEDGPAIAILWASMAAIYQRFGYAVVSRFRRYRVEPRYIEFATPQPVAGRYRAFSRDAIAALGPVYERFASDRSAYIQRDDHVWNHLTFGYSPDRVLCIGYEEGGELLGYVLYTAEFKPRAWDEFGPGVQVEAHDLTWSTPTAYRALWQYLKGIDLAKEIRLFRVPLDDPAQDLFLEPRQLRDIQGDGILARIVDVERALAARRYDAEGSLTFDVLDTMAPWNVGTWELQTGEGSANVRRTDRAPQVTLPVNTLAPLLFGHYSAGHAARIGTLTVHDWAALPMWDAVFRTSLPPGCANGF